MNFRDYRKEMGWTLADAARLLGLADGSTVAKHEIGACLPSVDLLARYDKLTGGKVTASDFIVARQRFKSDPEKARRKVGARRHHRVSEAAIARG